MTIEEKREVALINDEINLLTKSIEDIQEKIDSAKTKNIYPESLEKAKEIKIHKIHTLTKRVVKIKSREKERVHAMCLEVEEKRRKNLVLEIQVEANKNAIRKAELKQCEKMRVLRERIINYRKKHEQQEKYIQDLKANR